MVVLSDFQWCISSVLSSLTEYCTKKFECPFGNRHKVYMSLMYNDAHMAGEISLSAEVESDSLGNPDQCFKNCAVVISPEPLLIALEHSSVVALTDPWAISLNLKYGK